MLANSDNGLKQACEDLGAPPKAEAVAAAMGGRLEIGPIGIFCDYDVDGGCSSAIMKEAIKVLDPSQDIPLETADRDSEGFGPNRRALEALAKTGAKTVLVLDCGTESGALLDEFAEKDLCPIIIDHHPPRGHQKPTRGMTLNPWCDEETRWRRLCTGALAWWTALACIRQAEVPKAQSTRMRMRITALAGLATACDSMTLEPDTVEGRFNRALVTKSTQCMQVAGPGLMAILDRARTHPKKVQTQDLSWRIGPRINAGSRSGASNLAARCLNEEDESKSREMAEKLAELNRARRERCNEATAKALSERDTNTQIRIVWDADLNPGNAGVVAGKILEKDPDTPVIVMARAEDGQWRGSGRSNTADLGAMVEKGMEEGWLNSGGGHALACGVGVDEEGRENAQRKMVENIGQGRPSGTNQTKVDIALSDEDITEEGLERMRQTLGEIEPFGKQWESPKIGIKAAVVTEIVERTKNAIEAMLSIKARVGETTIEASWLTAPAKWEDLVEGFGNIETRWGRRKWTGERPDTDLMVEITGPEGARECTIREMRMG